MTETARAGGGPSATGTLTPEHDAYYYPPTQERFTRYSTIADATKGKRYLINWGCKLTAEYCVDNLPVLAALLADAEDGGRDAAVLLAKAESERIRGLKRDTGGYVHDVAAALILWQAGGGGDLVLPLLPAHLEGALYDEDPVEFVAEWMIDGFLNWVADWHPEFRATEMTVFHPGLKVAGTLDINAFLPGIQLTPAGLFTTGPGQAGMVDVKTGKILDETWQEQVAFYRAAPECQPLIGSDVHPNPYSDFGAVLHLRPEHPRCYRFMPVGLADEQAAWETFTNSVGVYRDRAARQAKPGKVAYPPRPDGSIPPPLLADLDREGWGRAPGALIKAGFKDLDQVAAKTAGQLTKIKGIKTATLAQARLMLADYGRHLAGEGDPGRA